MNMVQIKSGRVELCKANGSLLRTIGNADAVTANLN